jgi:soluble lytic murein transglycosylase-like protein
MEPERCIDPFAWLISRLLALSLSGIGIYLFNNFQPDLEVEAICEEAFQTLLAQQAQSLNQEQQFILIKMLLDPEQLHDLDPLIILALIEQESGYRPDVVGVQGSAYLSRLHHQFQDWHLTLTAYNAGPSRIRGRLRRQIRFNMKYAARVLLRYRKLKEMMKEYPCVKSAEE